VINKPTAEQILVASRRELERIRKLLVAARNRQYRDSGEYPDIYCVLLERLDFVLYSLMAGLVSPAEPKEAKKPQLVKMKIDRERVQ
jgi:hypothetical protein